MNSFMTNSKPLWTPSTELVESAKITEYLSWLKQHKGLIFDDYEALWQWSVTQIEDFWESIWQYGGIISHSPYNQVLNQRTMPGAKWFTGATLNAAEHALAFASNPDSANTPAIISESEIRPRIEISWRALAEKTGSLAACLKELGVAAGDRVAAFMPNIPETSIAHLAAISRGAIWSVAAPDMGSAGIVDRFVQIQPKILFAVDGYRYGGKDFDRRTTIIEMLKHLPSVEAVIFLPYLQESEKLDINGIDNRELRVVNFNDALAQLQPPVFTAVPFDHPVQIVYSSGTTGMPKPIVHDHGGGIIQNIKFMKLHLDLRPGDRFFWFSSTAWIMWNVLVSTLNRGVTVLMFDGNPGYPDLGVTWRFAERERATFFGTSPAFISLCKNSGINPQKEFDLSALRTVGCTGSPLSEDGYRWVYECISPTVMLNCISGGTDPGACFLNSCPIVPIYAGEMACRELGVATFSYDEAGNELSSEVGELVMTKPIPCMPQGFWGDDDGTRYFESYFATYPGVWRHGDWLQLVPRKGATAGIIFGRSDATINRHGIRMGTSEFYRVVEELRDVVDSLVVDLEYLGREPYLALFVVLREPSNLPTPSGDNAGQASVTNNVSHTSTGLEAPLRSEIMQVIRAKLSARHTPNEIFVIPEVPYTISGKKMEVPVKKILLGKSIDKSANPASMRNPQSLDWFAAFANSRNALLES